MSRTLRSPVSCSGIGIHTGKPVNVHLLPREEHGIVFVRTDLAGCPTIAAEARNLAPATRCTRLHCDSAAVMMVEHLLAACMGLEVKALTVETDAEELPIGDGSSLLWCNAFGAAGLRRLDADAASMGVPNPISVTDEEASITLEPASEWHLEYRGVFFDGSEQSVIWRSGSDFKHDIAPARTFCRLSEALYLRERGLIAGGSLDNAVLWVDDYGKESETVAAELGLHNLMVTEEHLPFPQRLRFPDEFARHKLQDLMGDLMLARNLAPCSVTARMSGHELNHALLHALRDANTLS